MKKDPLVMWTVKVTKKFDIETEKIIQKKAPLAKSEYIREAVREKNQRENASKGISL
jgi:Arc/MetJ-type ribon-helix-helix transcriptional regulator